MDYVFVLLSALIVFSNGHVSAQLQVDVNPPELVVKEGDPVQFVCRVGQPIMYCFIKTPNGRSLNLSPSPQASNLGIQYMGEGFQQGQCGVRIERSSGSDNGVFECNMGVSGAIDGAAGQMRLTVARPPQQPELRLMQQFQYEREYSEGDTLEASCIVRQGRPPANITWMMGNDTIHSGLTHSLITDDTRGIPNAEQTFSVSQNLSRTLSWHDHGKKLRCVANHVAFDENRELATEVDVQVRFGPQPSKSSVIEQYGFMEGSEGIITVEIFANPQPRMQWRIDNSQDMVEGESNNMYAADIAQQVESGKYEAKLRILNVSPADINKRFVLTASNDIGTQSYTVKISTEPAAMDSDLGTVGIVAIVIAVLVLFVIILLVCFARMTGRWCFAAGVPIRSDKESINASPTHEGGFHGFWARLTPNYRSVSTMEDIPPIPITLPPETHPINYTNIPAVQNNPVTVIPTFQETNLDTVHEESGGALHSSDTESADRAPVGPKDENARKSFFKMPAFLNKKSGVKQTPLEDVKTVPTEEQKQQKNAGVGGDTVVYAELDLAGAGRKAADKTVLRDDDKTEYAQIIHSKQV